MTHQIDCSPHSTMQVCMLGWGVSFADVIAARKWADKSQSGITLDDFLSQGIQQNEPNFLPDLPKDLAFLDVEGVLPKLSSLSLSSSGKE